jgi:hypothetical protein
MLTAGLNENLVRTLINTATINSITHQSVLYMFSGSVPPSLESLDLNVGSLTENLKSLLQSADGVCFPNIALDKSDGLKIKANISSGDFGGIREKIGTKKGAYIPDISQQVFDLNTSGNRALGDCVLYRLNNAWADWQAGTGLPALVIPPVLPPLDSVNSLLQMTGINCQSGQKIRTFEQLDSYGTYLGRRGSTTAGVTNDSHRAHTAIVFDEPVQADFLLFRMLCQNNVATRTFSNVSLILPNNSIVELPTFTATQNISYVLNFTKTLIKGLRLATTHQTFSSTQARFYATYFTAGLKDWELESDLSDNTRNPFTWGILVPTPDPTASALTERKLPLALVTIGDPASGADIEFNGRSEHYIRPNCIVNKQLFELNL